MTRRRLVLGSLAVAAVLLAIGYAADQAWLVAITILAIIAALVSYALGLLAQGQREWFGRRDRR